MYQATAPSDSSVNIRHFLIMALGGTLHLHELIDRLYKEKELEYYELYRKSGFFNDVVIATYMTENEDRMRKVAGIIEWCYEHNNFDVLYRIIKKGFKFTYQYVEHRKSVDMEEYYTSFSKRKRGGDNFSDLELFHNEVVCLYLCYRENKPCNLRNVSGEIFLNALQDAYFNAMVKEINFNDERKSKDKEKIESLYSEYPIPKKFDDKMNVSRLFEYIIQRKTEEIAFRDNIVSYTEAREKTFKEPFIKEIGALSGWVKAMGINEMDLTDLTLFSREDMDTVFMEYFIANNENDITLEQRDLFIVSCIWIQALAHHYNKTKRLYLDQSKNEHYLDIKHREKIISDKEQELKSKEEELKKGKEDSKQRIKKLEQELRKAQATIREHEQKQKTMVNYSKEVHALRSFIYEQQNQNEQPIMYSVEDMIDTLKTHSIAIFGGHPNWKQKMKEALPTCQFIDVDEINKDISFINRLEAVFVNTSVFNHSFYRKLMSQLNKNETKLFYLDGRSNVSQVIAEMHTFMTKI